MSCIEMLSSNFADQVACHIRHGATCNGSAAPVHNFSPCSTVYSVGCNMPDHLCTVFTQLCSFYCCYDIKV